MSTVSPVATNAFDQYVTDDLIGYWSFDKNTILGNMIKEIIRGGNAGTINGDPEVVAGKLKEALKFDGEEDHVSIRASAINNLAAGTIEAWVKIDSNEGGGAIIAKDHGGDPNLGFGPVFSIGFFANENGNLKQGEDGILYFQSKHPDGPKHLESSFALSAKAWHHVVVTFDTIEITEKS